MRMVLHESNEFRVHMPHFAPHMIFNPYLLSFGYDPFEAFEIRFSLKSSTWSNAILKNDQSARFYHPGAYFSQMIGIELRSLWPLKRYKEQFSAYAKFDEKKWNQRSV